MEKYRNPESKILWEALDRYFYQHDRDTICSANQRFPTLFSLGPLWVADHLDSMHTGIKNMLATGLTNEEIVEFVLMDADIWIGYAKELARFDGKKAGRGLMTSFTTARDEDEMALIGIVLDEDMVRTTKPTEKLFFKSVLSQMYRDIVGTGCRFTTSLLLNTLGEAGPLNEFKRLGYPSKDEMIKFTILDIAFKGTVIQGLMAGQKHLGWVRKE